MSRSAGALLVTIWRGLTVLVALGLALAQSSSSAGYRREVESVCRGFAEFVTRPAPLRTCDTGTLEIDFRHTCRAQRVHLVYVVNANSLLTTNEYRYLTWSLQESVRLLNLRANPNIRAAVVEIGEDDAVSRTGGFSNDLSTVFRALRQHGAPVGCLECGLELAHQMLKTERDVVLPDHPAELIAFFGYIGDENRVENRDVVSKVDEIHSDGIVFIGPDRELATSDAYWTGGPIPSAVVFRSIEVNFNGTALRNLELELALPSGLNPDPRCVDPPAGDGDGLLWRFDAPAEGTQITLTVQVDVAPTVDAGPVLRARLADWRGRIREIELPGAEAPPLPLEDGCSRPTPTPGGPTPTATATLAVPTAGPTPTLPGRRVRPAFLPLVSREPCLTSAREFDVVLVVDASGSMRRPGNDDLRAAAEASRELVHVLATPSDPIDRGARRMSLVRFDWDAVTLVELTDDWSAVLAGLDRLAVAPVRAGTRLSVGLRQALDELEARGRSDRPRAVVFVTDGTPVQGHDEVLGEALRAQELGATVHCIGLGDLVHAQLLEQVAGDLERYYHAVDAAALDGIFRRIGHELRCR